jgi:hypothetical protein
MILTRRSCMLIFRCKFVHAIKNTRGANPKQIYCLWSKARLKERCVMSKLVHYVYSVVFEIRP